MARASNEKKFSLVYHELGSDARSGRRSFIVAVGLKLSTAPLWFDIVAVVAAVSESKRSAQKLSVLSEGVLFSGELHNTREGREKNCGTILIFYCDLC